MKNRYLIASVVAALSIGTLAGAQLASTAAPQPESVFTPIVPCRIMDTRPTSKIGPNATLGAGTVRTLDTWGTNGECTLPSNTTAISMNVTVVGGTAPSFLTIWPSDATTRPETSSLNWVAGQAPTPNKVDVALSSKGKVKFYNLAGSVDVVVDVVGYYTPASDFGTVTIVTAPITLGLTMLGDGSNGSAIATCPAGQVAISGGVESPTSYPFNVRSSRPNPKVATNPTGWFGDVRSADFDADTLAQVPTVYVMCVTR